jgi:hypothetical protein
LNFRAAHCGQGVKYDQNPMKTLQNPKFSAMMRHRKQGMRPCLKRDNRTSVFTDQIIA